MRFAFIQARKAQFPVSAMCRILEVSHSGFFAWCSRPESARARDDRRLKVQIRASHEASKRRYGSPRIHQDLKAAGEQVSRKRIARLMKEEGIAARRRRRFVRPPIASTTCQHPTCLSATSPQRSQTSAGWET